MVCNDGGRPTVDVFSDWGSCRTVKAASEVPARGSCKLENSIPRYR